MPLSSVEVYYDL